VEWKLILFNFSFQGNWKIEKPLKFTAENQANKNFYGNLKFVYFLNFRFHIIVLFSNVELYTSALLLFRKILKTLKRSIKFKIPENSLDVIIMFSYSKIINWMSLAQFLTNSHISLIHPSLPSVVSIATICLRKSSYRYCLHPPCTLYYIKFEFLWKTYISNP
jgi:hypothetical protein